MKILEFIGYEDEDSSSYIALKVCDATKEERDSVKEFGDQAWTDGKDFIFSDFLEESELKELSKVFGSQRTAFMGFARRLGAI